MSGAARPVAVVAAGLALAAAVGCEQGSDGDGGGGADGGGGSGGEVAKYTVLIAGEWQLEPYSEEVAKRFTVPIERDLYVRAIRPLSPEGTHHSGLGISRLGKSTSVFAAGLGTDALELPPGVALKLPAGSSLVLELHIFNPGGEPLSGTSGVEVIEVEERDVTETADVFLAGPIALELPPNAESTVRSTCIVGAPYTLFALMPHMHQLGSHLRTVVRRDGEEIVLHDEAFSFEQQTVRLLDPIALSAGDQIVTECTFDNSTPLSVSWGESSNDEMCFSVLYRYPVTEDGGLCAF